MMISERQIRQVAQMISFGVPLEEIRADLLQRGYLEEEVFLLYQAVQVFLRAAEH